MSAHTDNERREEGGCVPRLVRDYFEDDGAPKKCPKCESTKITEKVLAVVDVFQGMGPTCEAEYYCECGECVGFWAYGSWHPEHRESFIANANVTHRVPTNNTMELQKHTGRDSVESTELFAAIDALRGALGDNPCVLLEADERGEHFRRYFSDHDLEAAIKAVIPHLPPCCPNCGGRGWMFSNQTRNREKCRRCEGSGFLSANA